MSIQVGDEARLTKVIRDGDVMDFAYLTGDVNPVHLDDDFAKKTRFGKRIAHGMMPASMVSAVLGTKLPGPGTIYLSQTLQFVGPVYINDTITATVRVIKIREDKPILTLETICVNQEGQLILKGEAVVLYEKSME